MAEQRVTDAQLTEWLEYLNAHPDHLATASLVLSLIADLRASRAREAELRAQFEATFETLRRKRADLVDARAERDVLQERIDNLLAATYASDDGTEHIHNHRRGEGEFECPACWVHDIRTALTGTEPDRA